MTERWEEALNRLGSAQTLVYDAETSGLDWRHCHIVGHVLTFGPAPQDSYYLPVRHAGGGNIGNTVGPKDRHGWNGKLHKIEADLLKKMGRQDLHVIGHHLNFDLRFLAKLGDGLSCRYEDTMLNATLLDEWQGRFSLEFCANAAGVQAKKSSEMNEYLARKFPDLCEVKGKGDKAPMAHYWRLSGKDQKGIEYAEGDGTTTWQLWNKQTDELSRQELNRVHDVECRLIPILARMSFQGIRVDEERLERLIDFVDFQLDRLYGAFPDGFNVRSPNDVEKWCRDHGQTDWPLTPKGRPSFAESWLRTHEPGQKITKVRKFETLKSTFLYPMKETHLFRGRVHTTFNQLRNDEFGTVTGRLSSSDPNLQAVTKHDPAVGLLHRSIFVPDEGMRWATADFSQIEPRLLACYCRAKVLLDGYNATPPVDAHTSVSMACRPDWDEMTPAERKQYRDEFGKRINQTVITGGGRGVLVSKYGMSLDFVDDMLSKYHAAMPELKPFQKRAARRMKRKGYVLSLLGRRARLNNPDKDYVALNRLLQCGNADIIKSKMVQIDDYLASEGRPLDMLNNIHDDICYQFVEDQRKHFDECLNIMTDFGSGQPIELDVPVEVDAGEGDDWAQATYHTTEPPAYTKPKKEWGDD